MTPTLDEVTTLPPDDLAAFHPPEPKGDWVRPVAALGLALALLVGVYEALINAPDLSPSNLSRLSRGERAVLFDAEHRDIPVVLGDGSAIGGTESCLWFPFGTPVTVVEDVGDPSDMNRVVRIRVDGQEPGAGVVRVYRFMLRPYGPV